MVSKPLKGTTQILWICEDFKISKLKLLLLQNYAQFLFFEKMYANAYQKTIVLKTIVFCSFLVYFWFMFAIYLLRDKICHVVKGKQILRMNNFETFKIFEKPFKSQNLWFLKIESGYCTSLVNTNYINSNF